MKFLKNGGGAGFALLLLLFTVSSAFAQATRYIDPEKGSGTTCTRSAPCQLVEAYKKSNPDNTNFLIRVPFPGGTVTLVPPGSGNPLSEKVRFGTYVQESDGAVEGTIKFTEHPTVTNRHFRINPNGQFRLDAKAKVEFKNVWVEARALNSDFFHFEAAERITITGTLFLNRDGSNAARLHSLVVSQDMTIQAAGTAGAYLAFVGGGLTIKNGATLTLKRSVNDLSRIGRVELSLFFKKGSSSTDPQGLLTVDGTIQGHPGMDALITTDYLGKGNRANFTPRIPTDAYDPSTNGVDQNDCVRIAGKGTIQNVRLQLIALGNVCVDLKQVDDLEVFGSIVEPSGVTEANISTDVIFRSEVIVDGNIDLWGDARMVFEKTATIRGDISLDDGTYPTDILGTAFGVRRSGSVRRGVQIGGKGKFSCLYTPRGPDGKDNKKRGMHIPGMQFEDAVTIEGDVKVKYSSFTDGAAADTKPKAPACAPRVLFLAPLSGTTTRESVIKGALTVEDAADFEDRGRVHLDADTTGASKAKRPKTVHNVRIEGGISAQGNTIGMGYASTLTADGMCTAKDTGLTFGNHILFGGTDKQSVTGRGSEVILDAVMALDELAVPSGPLAVKTLHVGPRAELMGKNVKVTESLLLQGELSGELDEASTIKKLTYGSRNTDLVKKAALSDTLDALAIHIGSGELRLDEAVKTKNLGLCSGTLSLVDAESTTDSTLHVMEHITVQNGMLEKDSNDPGSISTDKAKTANVNDRYVLTYITPGKRTVTDALEWFDPRDVVVNHASAEITTSGDRSIVGKLMITKGKLMVDGMLTVGTSILDRTSAAKVDNYSVVVAAGELHTEGQDVRVHGKVTVKGKSKLMTEGGDLHVLGRVSQGKYIGNTAQVTVEKDAMIHLGDGTLMLGPEDTSKRTNVKDNDRPDVLLTLTGSLTADIIKVPKGSKQTTIDASADSKMLQTVVFDGTMTPGTGNWGGTLYLKSATADGKMLTVDSLSAMQGSVELQNKKVMITKDVALSSATIWPTAETTEFMGNLMISGTGGLNSRYNNAAKRSILIHGDFMQTKGTVMEDVAGVRLHSGATKTVMGDFMVATDASRYVTDGMPVLMVHGGFHFAKKGDLNATVEFTGKEAQEVMTGDTTALHSVTVNNAKGLLLKSHVMQQKAATLTLRQGKIHSMPMDSMFMWTVQNVQAEQELRGRSTAQEGSKCGDKNNEACKATILRGSRQSYAATPVVRHLLQGVSGAGFASGGYLFPVGMEKGDMSHYRPLILQLPSDLIDTTAATVSPVMVPDGAMPAWQNLTVPTAGGSLTLDVHADLFWKVDLGTESLPTNTNLRIAAEGIRNVADASGLRIVQWDCMWKNPKLAGRRPAQVEAGSFAVNGYISGVLNLTQEGIGLGSCAIFGIAANGIENPIDQADLSGGRANLQFIHNVPLPTPINLHLGDIQIGSGMQFRSATAYRPVGAGSHELKIQPAGAPAEQAITQTLPLAHNKNYVVIAHGSLAEPMLKVLETRMTSQVANQVDVLLVHGSADLGAARVEVLDPVDPMTVNMTLAGNLMLNDATRRYASLAPSQQVLRVKSADQEVTQAYEMDLYGYANQTLVLNLSGMKEDLTILGIDKNGMVIPTVVVTGVEESAELPTEFALHGNYPNPFNPGTRIQFDLPENAQVRVQIVDMLGREVMVLPAQEMEAGANRSLELHATSLASGTYLYRLIATGAEQRHVKTGRMTLVK